MKIFFFSLMSVFFLSTAVLAEGDKNAVLEKGDPQISEARAGCPGGGDCLKDLPGSSALTGPTLIPLPTYEHLLPNQAENSKKPNSPATTEAAE